MSMKISKPIMPKEHGLWVWAILPLCVGAGSARGDAGNFHAVFAALFFWFMAFTPARMLYKISKKDAGQNRAAVFWCFAYALSGTAAVVYTATADARLMIFFAMLAPAFYIGVRGAYVGFQRNLYFESGGIFYLSGLSFMGAFAVAGEIKSADFAVWLFTLIFMFDRSLETRQIVRVFGRYAKTSVSEADLKLVCRINLFVSLASIAAISAVLEEFSLSRIFVLPFLPGFLTTLFFYIRPPETMRRVGLTELSLAIAYGVVFVRLSGNLY